MGNWRKGSASALHAEGCRFESDILHQHLTLRSEGVRLISATQGSMA